MRTSRLVQALIALSAIGTATLGAFAEDTRGRLPDGRAFRTDAQGLQLIDYTAELEVNIETLHRRVQSLEEQLKEREQQLASKRTPSASELTERTIATTHTQAEAACPERSCPPAPHFSCPETDRRAEIAEAQSAVRAERAAAANSGDGAVLAYKQALERQGLRTKSLSDQVAIQAQTIAQQDLALAAARTQLATLQNSNAELSAQIARRASERSMQVASAPLAPRLVEPSAPPERLEPHAALSMARLQAVDSVRGTVSRELNELSALLATRSSVYNNRKNRDGPVSFTLQAPRARDGRTLAMIREEIQDASQMRQLAALRGDIQQIKAAIQEDIAFIQRMERSGQGR